MNAGELVFCKKYAALSICRNKYRPFDKIKGTKLTINFNNELSKMKTIHMFKDRYEPFKQNAYVQK